MEFFKTLIIFFSRSIIDDKMVVENNDEMIIQILMFIPGFFLHFAGTRQRCDRRFPPSASESGVQLLRGWTSQTLETLRKKSSKQRELLHESFPHFYILHLCPYPVWREDLAQRG